MHNVGIKSLNGLSRLILIIHVATLNACNIVNGLNLEVSVVCIVIVRVRVILKRTVVGD